MPTITISLVLAALFSLSILPGAGSAGPKIIVTNTAGQCINGVPTIIVTLDSTTWDWYKPKLYYHNPSVSPAVQELLAAVTEETSSCLLP